VARRRRLAQIPHEPGYEFASVRWLRRGIAERRFAFAKCGGLLVVDLDDLDDYISSCRVEPPASQPLLRAVRS